MAIVMNKVTTKSKRALRFNDLIIGEIFLNEYGSWFMKTHNIYDYCGDLIGNAIELNGDIALFDSEQTVKKFKKDLTINYLDDDIIEWYE